MESGDVAASWPFFLEGVRLKVEARSAPTCTSDAGHSVTMWTLRRGNIAGIDASGLTIVDVRVIGRHGQVLLVGEQATPEQVRQLRDAFEGRDPRPLAALVTGVGKRLGFYLVSVEEHVAEGRRTLSAGRMIRVTMPAGVTAPRPSDCEMSISIPEVGLHGRSRCTLFERGDFSVDHVGGPMLREGDEGPPQCPLPVARSSATCQDLEERNHDCG
jgi:hypothetical protein